MTTIMKCEEEEDPIKIMLKDGQENTVLCREIHECF